MACRKIARLASVGMALALLAGCGGGGDEGAPFSPVQVTPPPTATPSPSPAPSPTPSPAILYPPAPTEVKSATEFTLFGFSSESVSALKASDVELRWLGSPATYGLRITGVGEGELRQRSASDPALYLVDRNGVTLLDSLDIPRPLALYSGLIQGFKEPRFRALFGIVTPSTSVPTTGSRSYANAGIDGGAPMRITVDFAARRVSGTIGIAWQDAWGPYAPTTFNLTPETFSPGAVEFSVPIEIPGAPAPGTLSARFAGPNAEEMMVTWRAPLRNPYEDGWVTFSGLQVVGQAAS